MQKRLICIRLLWPRRELLTCESALLRIKSSAVETTSKEASGLGSVSSTASGRQTQERPQSWVRPASGVTHPLAEPQRAAPALPDLPQLPHTKLRRPLLCVPEEQLPLPEAGLRRQGQAREERRPLPLCPEPGNAEPVETAAGLRVVWIQPRK